MEAIIYIIIGIAVAVAGAAKYAHSRELSAKLGREVEDYELVSLNSWMEAERLTDARKGIETGEPLISSSGQKAAPVVKEKPNRTTPAKNAVAEAAEKPFEPPNNCARCGAALSKEISRCRFCGTHSSRKSLEEHTSVFLQNIEEDFDAVVPAFYSVLRLGCFLIPLLGVTATITAYALIPRENFGYALLFGIPILSMIAAYIWLNAVDVILTKREGILFERTIKPQIREFMDENHLESLELIGIAKRHFNEDSKFLKHIYRRF